MQNPMLFWIKTYCFLTNYIYIYNSGWLVLTEPIQSHADRNTNREISPAH